MIMLHFLMTASFACLGLTPVSVAAAAMASGAPRIRQDGRHQLTVDSTASFAQADQDASRLVRRETMEQYQQKTIAKENNSAPLPKYCAAAWTTQQVIGSDNGRDCSVTTMVDAGQLSGARAPQLCIKSYHDIVSDQVRSEGRWRTCDLISDQWKALHDRSLDPRYGAFQGCSGSALPAKKVYLEIGPGVGACTAQMLARTDVPHVIAFEWKQADLFYLTNTVVKNTGFGDKFTLFTSDAGAEPGLVPDATAARTLDDLYMSAGVPIYVHLMRLNAHGHELQVLQGSQRLIAMGAVGAIKFDIRQCKAKDVFSLLNNMNFDIYEEEEGRQPLSAESLKEIACHHGVVIKEFIAVWSAKTLPTLNIQCSMFS